MHAAEKLNQLVADSISGFTEIPEEQWAFKPLPGKWSKKEILGHLIDSAINNQVRIIKSVAAPTPLIVESYMQDEWVKRNNYQSQPADLVINKWRILQGSISNLVNNLLPGEMLNKIFLSDGSKVTLEWLINDYVSHQEHHLEQILG